MCTPALHLVSIPQVWCDGDRYAPARSLVFSLKFSGSASRDVREHTSLDVSTTKGKNVASPVRDVKKLLTGILHR